MMGSISEYNTIVASTKVSLKHQKLIFSEYIPKTAKQVRKFSLNGTTHTLLADKVALLS